MRTLVAIILSVIVIGCSNTPQSQQTCDNAKKLYEAYQTSLLVRQPSTDEIKAAQVAASFLTLYCGWNTSRELDVNGVPIIAEQK